MLLIWFWADNIQAEIKKPPSAPHLNASLDTDQAIFGSLVELTLEYDLPKDGRLQKPLRLKGLEGLTVVDRTQEAGRIRVKVLVDRINIWETSALAIDYLDEKGRVHTLSADPVSLKVSSRLDEQSLEGELRPISDILPTRAWWLKYWPWTFGSIGILTGGMGLYYWRRKKRRHISGGEFRAPPHLRARREIETLLEEGLIEKGQVKAFYFRFSEILRWYLESLRGFPAAEYTTEEIVGRIDRHEDRALIPLLRQADLVKFADTEPSPATTDEEIQQALTYIQKTSPVVETTYAAVETEEDSRGL